VLDEILRQEKQEQRPQPQNKRLRAVLTREVDGQEVNAKDVIFDWLADEVRQRDPHEERTVVAVMDGETKLRDLQELKIRRAIGILDIWHVTEYLWKLAYCFHPEGSDQAEAFVDTYLRKLLQGKVRRVVGGIRQMVTKGGLSKHKREKAQQYLNYFAQRCDYMKYDEYLAAGYPIGSGVVEGACVMGRPKPASHGRVETGHLKEVRVRHLALSIPHWKEMLDGEPTDDGQDQRDPYTPQIRSQQPQDRGASGRPPGDGGQVCPAGGI
jgi:hypothetical protein